MRDSLFSRTTCALPAWLFWLLWLGTAGAVLVFVLTSVTEFSASVRYQRFAYIRAFQHISDSTVGHAEAVDAIRGAMARNPAHAAYGAELGAYVLEHALRLLSADAHAADAGEPPDAEPAPSWEEIEALVTQALLRDPANPWYAYALGRISNLRGACGPPVFFESGRACRTARVYRAALRNYPKNLFVRRELLAWWLAYDPDEGRRMIRQLVAQDEEEPLLPHTVPEARSFAAMLYRVAEDDASERELRLARAASGTDPEAHDAPSPIMRRGAVDVVGRDDGTADWYAPLTSPEQRVRKRFCLPDDLSAYRAASLRLLLSAGPGMAGGVRIALDDAPLALSGAAIPTIPAWQEVPVPVERLRGKACVSVYVRVTQPAAEQEALRVWGDARATTRDSLWNFEQSADLSSADGTQAGEYAIRLLLYR